MGHVYTVEFRIFSETLDPALITNELGLQPCQVRIQGSRRADGKTFTGMWAFDGIATSSTQGTDWDSLEEGLIYVLDKLWPKKEIIASYARGADLVWWCGHFQSSFDGGPELSPSLLSRLGEFGASYLTLRI
jgi:uncharacterized protein DUF4279